MDENIGSGKGPGAFLRSPEVNGVVHLQPSFRNASSARGTGWPAAVEGEDCSRICRTSLRSRTSSSLSFCNSALPAISLLVKSAYE